MNAKHPDKRVIVRKLVSVSAVALLCETLAVSWIYKHGGLTPLNATSVMIATMTGMVTVLCYSVFGPVANEPPSRAGARSSADGTGGVESETIYVIESLKESWGLSNAEAEVTVYAVKGFSNKEISELRGASIATVKKQLGSVYRKSGLANRFQLIAHVNDEEMSLIHGAATPETVAS
jgi:DNA-binding CsgD family transcriptional regulator